MATPGFRPYSIVDDLGDRGRLAHCGEYGLATLLPWEGVT